MIVELDGGWESLELEVEAEVFGGIEEGFGQAGDRFEKFGELGGLFTDIDEKEFVAVGFGGVEGGSLFEEVGGVIDP